AFDELGVGYFVHESRDSHAFWGSFKMPTFSFKPLHEIFRGFPFSLFDVVLLETADDNAYHSILEGLRRMRAYLDFLKFALSLFPLCVSHRRLGWGQIELCWSTHGREKTLRDADATPKVNIQDLCEEYYEDILRIIMDKIRCDKQKEVHARLDFKEGSRERRTREDRTGQALGIVLAIKAVLTSETLLMKIVLRVETDVAASGNHMTTLIPPMGPTTDIAIVTETAPAVSRGERIVNPHYPAYQRASPVTEDTKRAARVWFDELPPKSINSYKDLKDGETIEDFMERFKVETGHMKGALECMWISGFMHGVNNPELIKCLNEDVQKTMKEMMITTTIFKRGEATAVGKKKGRGSSRFTTLTRTPKEILAAEAGKVQPPPPMKVTQSFERFREITFASLATSNGIEGPLVIEAKIGGHMIYRMYVDEGSSTEVIYEHYFNQLWLNVKNQMVLATTSLTGLSGETIWPLGQLRLLVTIGDDDHSTRAWMNFMISSDIAGVPESVAEHRLNIREGYLPVRQKKRGQALERAKAIQAEDCYPLPEIDWKVESLCGYPFKCFLNAYKGYHQFAASNNEAEYEALIAGLRIAAQMRVQNVHVCALIQTRLGRNTQKIHTREGGDNRGRGKWTNMDKTNNRIFEEWTVTGDRKEASKLRIKARQYELLEGVLYRWSFFTPWLRAHRTMIKSSHGDTPFSLTNGTKVVIPAEIEMPTYRTAAVDTIHKDEELRLNLALLKKRRERAAIHEAKAKLKMTKYYNARVRGVTYRLGEFVCHSNYASHAVD
nr:reverse transcriptase domain-containing protein [Tanacetum cinerariifolium]